MTAHLKIPFQDSINRFAEQKLASAQNVRPKSWPCQVTEVNGALVTVKFLVNGPNTIPPVQMPIAESAYVTLPVQIGDLGYTVPSDVYLGGVSGLGGGTAGLAQRGNLATLVYMPLSNAAWTIVDPNSVIITGVGSKGAIIRTGTGNCSITVQDGEVNIVFTGAAGVVNVTNGDVIADGISLKMHVHGGVISGGADTGPPV